MYHLMTLKSIKIELYVETFKMRRFIMVRKSESINRKPIGEEIITFTDRKGREKEVTVLNSVIFTDKEKRVCRNNQQSCTYREQSKRQS